MRRIRALLVVTILIFIGTFGLSSLKVGATWSSYRHGYFDGNYYQGNFNWPNLGWYNNGYVIPEGVSANSIVEFMNMIRCNYYNDVGNPNCPFRYDKNGRTSEYGYQRRTAASYIVHSMLGDAQGTVGRDFADPEAAFAEVESRLNYINSYGGINWNANYYTHYDGALDKTPDVYIWDDVNRWWGGPAIVMRDTAGNNIYALFRACANPDGNLSIGLPTTPPKGYTLTPGFSVSPSNVTEIDTQISLTPVVDNSGPANSSSTTWTLSRTVTGSPGENGTVSVASGSAVFTASPSRTYLASYSETANYDAGARVCFILSATPHSNTDAGTVSSTPACTVVGKKPKIQILGGDLLVGGLISTSTSVKSTTTFGSWAEYGVFATSTIKGLASGAAFSGGLVGATTCTSGVLSFTNAGSSTCVANTTVIGNYTNTNSSTDIAASFPGGSAVPAGIPSSWPSGIYNAGDLTLNASNLGAGKTIVIKSTGTVTIAGNQTYTNGPYASISDLPQLVIIANKIVINSSVTNVDAWLVAKNSAKTGIIQTCESVGNSINTCNTKLTVNGPVMTDHLYLYRTAGSGTGAASGDPAEVFNLRADAYLWAQAQAVNRSRVQTVYTTELPPRL